MFSSKSKTDMTETSWGRFQKYVDRDGEQVKILRQLYHKGTSLEILTYFLNTLCIRINRNLDTSFLAKLVKTCMCIQLSNPLKF